MESRRGIDGSAIKNIFYDVQLLHRFNLYSGLRAWESSPLKLVAEEEGQSAVMQVQTLLHLDTDHKGNRQRDGIE